MPRMPGFVGPPVRPGDNPKDQPKREPIVPRIPADIPPAPPKPDVRAAQRSATIAQIEAERAPRLAEMEKALAHLPYEDREAALEKIRKGE